VGRGRG
jgi:hypothetical protein